MALDDYKGAANSNEVFQTLVGEKIVACFLNDRGDLYLVTKCGAALVVHPNGEVLAWWVEKKADVDRIVAKRRAEIERKIAELRQLGSIEIERSRSEPRGMSVEIVEPVANCDGSGLYAYDRTREDGRGVKLALPCSGCRACR